MLICTIDWWLAATWWYGLQSSKVFLIMYVTWCGGRTAVCLASSCNKPAQLKVAGWRFLGCPSGTHFKGHQWSHSSHYRHGSLSGWKWSGLQCLTLDCVETLSRCNVFVWRVAGSKVSKPAVNTMNVCDGTQSQKLGQLNHGGPVALRLGTSTVAKLWSFLLFFFQVHQANPASCFSFGLKTSIFISHADKQDSDTNRWYKPQDTACCG